MKTECSFPQAAGLADAWTYRRYLKDDVWAFQPLLSEFDHDSIDGFIVRKLADADLSPATQASPQQLIRRATFDLTGLPPTPRQIDQFLEGWKQDPDQAWSDVVDRLLQSPHYGERWAQHWLDVVRYADTGGFSNDYERSNAWRYPRLRDSLVQQRQALRSVCDGTNRRRRTPTR